ncbi:MULTISPECIES: porphobilinogen synthase [Fusobacterium]|uniref:porphobilinogen synthase n=1 Tax=Fusobacterium TaxID=848 RepID=UPI001F1E3C48|nr:MULTISPECIES: porphobilinogen synthase [Fusobacterium]MCF2612576.1 porphobilinogen synthase [Fusobacterium perfoetens]MDY2980447.1 porphobilinogen synthase [Fusobacterium sp.]
MFTRTRRLRQNGILREMVRNITINLDQFIYPIFVEEGTNIKEEIPSMPNQYRYSIDMLSEELKELKDLGIKSLLLFGIPKIKDEVGSEAYNDNGIVQEAVRYIKKNFPEFLIVTDVCMCEYTSHGHCGILNGNDVNNDVTLNYLAKIAVSHVKAGADIVAPSDMMDGRIQAIREALDKNGYINTPIMAYSVKYASSYYGPFRDAADSAPSFGDRKTYQMDFRNSKDYKREVIADTEEGADFIMVKPALPYLDVIKVVSEETNLPVVAYNVSGEYSMVKAASLNGWVDEKKIVMENMYAIRRAGADIIISYHTKDIAKWVQNGEIKL